MGWAIRVCHVILTPLFLYYLLIILPVFGRDEDEQVICIIKGVFPDRNIETIDYSDVAKEGGLLNCTTWVITK